MSAFTLHTLSFTRPITPHPFKPSLPVFRHRSLSLHSTFLPPLTLHSSRPNPFISLAAPREDSHVDKVEEDGEGEKEEWKQALESFKEQAMKMQSESREAYALYTKKGIVLLKETSERLKIQGDKASEDLNVILNEISENSKVFFDRAAENTPEPVKEIVESYVVSTEEVGSFEQLRDFHVGIPYGAGLSVGGFLYFMLTGSVSAIRFGVILGGALVALSIYSLRSYKKDGPSPVAVKGQAAIAGILFLRELRLLLQRASFSTLFATLFSGAMVGTYIYLFALAGKKKPNLENGTGN